ncbi:MAG TPA: ROK family glucokinase [Nocardioidaceae bacterium]|nr:ROK family glucokinase [Nocardioidaceae bacterium]
MTLTIGVDVGGTKIAAGVVDESGRIVERVRVDSPAADTEAMEDAIADAVRDLCRRHEVEAVGIGAAGFIDATRSTVLFAPNVAWRDEPLRTEIEARVDLPVKVENDANAAAWGEFQYGAGHDVDDLLLVTVGTGVGGGLVLDGELYRGGFGIAAEIGHMRVVPGGRLCGCGNRGCWEQYASGKAMMREVHEVARAGSPLSGALLERAGGTVDDITGEMVTEAAREGDGFAGEMIQETGRWLGEGIATLAAILDPAIVALGGGVAEAGDLLLEPVRAAFRGSLTGRRHRPELEIRKAQLGNTAGLVGAADLARR